MLFPRLFSLPFLPDVYFSGLPIFDTTEMSSNEHLQLRLKINEHPRLNSAHDLSSSDHGGSRKSEALRA